ncbi:MAG: hypothetical protein U0R64_05060 [Candidatus Nanopelagicales bacterium]
MIVRISGEGQYRLDDATIDELNELDAAIEAALDDDEAFTVALAAILDKVRADGEELADEELLESDVILPPSDATADDVRAMLKSDGLIPG